VGNGSRCYFRVVDATQKNSKNVRTKLRHLSERREFNARKTHNLGEISGSIASNFIILFTLRPPFEDTRRPKKNHTPLSCLLCNVAARVLPSKVTLPKKINCPRPIKRLRSIAASQRARCTTNVFVFVGKMGPSFPGFPEFMIMRNCYWEKYPSVKRSFLLWNLCNDLHMHLISWRTGLLLFRLTNLKLKHDKRNGTKR
jgi:hypothetical protein